MESKKNRRPISLNGPYLHFHQAKSYDRSFFFNDVKTSNCGVFIIDNALDTKESLLRSVAKGLSFPKYFGENWDALDECINDLSWLKAKGIVVVLEKADDLLKLPLDDLTIFMNIIAGAIDNWKKEDILLHFVIVCSSATLLQMKRIILMEIEEWE
jgi:hypothetical protein